MVDKNALERARSRYGFEMWMCISSEVLYGGMGFRWKDINVSIRSL